MLPVRNPRRLPSVVVTVSAGRVKRGGRAATWLEHETDPAAIAPAAMIGAHLRTVEHAWSLNLGMMTPCGRRPGDLYHSLSPRTGRKEARDRGQRRRFAPVSVSVSGAATAAAVSAECVKLAWPRRPRPAARR